VRWRRVRELFDDIVERDPAERLARLGVTCEGDPELRREVESLLAHDEAPDDTIENIVAEAAQDAVAGDGRHGTSPVPAIIGHYHIIQKLGEGGMGEVFLAEDTTLGRRIALKLPATPLATDADARARLLREARAAATLNHPHVCVVHDVGEGPDGRPFIAMEYVEGETLAARITRGRLPPEEVIKLGREAADALQEAHAHGVVHRDLKPSNIILTPHGIKLLDFGLASVARDPLLAREPDAGAFMGTIRYMSPEQARGEELDHRTDLFSLGVLLYEAATGRLPFDGDTPRAVRTATLEATPAAPTRIASDLPAGFDRIMARALAKNRDERYRTATELGADLARLGSRARRAWIVWAVAAAALVAVAIYALVAGLTMSRPAEAPHEKQTILVAGFSNTTGDPSFDGTLREVLMEQVQQTPFIRVFPEAGVRETLRLMARAPDEPLTPPIAKEIAVRRGIPAWIAGSIAPLGNHYVVSLVATSSMSGDVLARERVEVERKAQVLAALGRLTVQLRLKLGESASTIQKFSTPVEQATTASLDALKAYALGAEQSRRGDYPTAASLFQRAVQIDPDFALAHQAFARDELNSNYSDRVVAAATRAFELRARVTAREQASIVVFYHRSVTGDLDQAIAAASMWKRTYPSEWRPYHALADLYWSIGAYEKALEAAREAVRLNPDVAAAYSNLAGALYALERFDEAREVYRQAMARGFDAPEYHVFLWRIAFLTGDEEGMRQHADWAASSSTWALNILALSPALQGRWRESQARTAQTAALFDARGMQGLASRAMSYEAVDAALFGDCAASRRPVARVLSSQMDEEQAEAILVLALCGERERALRLGEALRMRRPLDTKINRIWLPSIRAAVALERGNPAQAIEMLRVAAPYDGAAESWPIYIRALALLRAGAGVEARAEFEKILSHPGWMFWPPFGPLSHLGRARAAAMTGDVETASRAYQDFFTLWRTADADLPVLVDARREYARLSR
jgi:tetratricopeptide (TPR) repeat protein/predicted Ser/Thr protein kinase